MNALLLTTPPLDVFGQMATDEALAQSHPEAFCLRFFRWQGAGLTFGYAQRFQAVERILPPGIGANWTRRPTGGGLVPHLDDLTFSCVFPDEGKLNPTGLYSRIHSAVHQALCEGGLDVRLSVSEGEDFAKDGFERASQCFKEPVSLDILMGETKILGGAIRRMGHTVLYQGSLQLPDARQRSEELEGLIQRHLANEWGLRWTRGEMDVPTQTVAKALEAKYRSVEWIQRR